MEVQNSFRIKIFNGFFSQGTALSEIETLKGLWKMLVTKQIINATSTNSTLMRTKDKSCMREFCRGGSQGASWTLEAHRFSRNFLCVSLSRHPFGSRKALYHKLQASHWCGGQEINLMAKAFFILCGQAGVGQVGSLRSWMLLVIDPSYTMWSHWQVVRYL